MKKNLVTTLLFASVLAVPMQAGIVKGTVIDSATREPVSGVVVSAAGGSIIATTAADGTYVLQGVEEGNTMIAFVRENYALQSVDVTVMQTPTTVNVEVERTEDARDVVSEGSQAAREENTLLFDESMLEDEGAASSQSVAYLAGSSLCDSRYVVMTNAIKPLISTE